MAMTLLARWAINCESVPSPAPRSAITMGGISFKQRFGDAFPGAAGDVLAAEFAGQFVEIAAHLVLALAQRETQRLPVLLRFGDFARPPCAADPSAPAGAVRR